MKLISHSPAETLELGSRLARTLSPGDVVLLTGTLGSGKTTLARGMAIGLGIEDPASVHSPSFTLVNRYQGRCPIYHADLYRVAGEREMRTIGLEDMCGSEGITIIEWGERMPGSVEATMQIQIFDLGGERRELRVVAMGQSRKPRRSQLSAKGAAKPMRL